MSYGYMPVYPTTYGQRPYMQQPIVQQTPQQMQPGYICRPVASEEEARAVPTDFTGATLVLVDSGHGSIYTKSLNPMDGSAVFATYRYAEPAPPAQETHAAFAPMEDLEKLRHEVADLRNSIQRRNSGKGGNTE